MTNIDIAQTGITHLSFSAVIDFLADRRNFRKRWIDHDFDRTPQLALIEGSAFHASAAAYWEQVKTNGKMTDPQEIEACARRSIEMEYNKATEPIKVRIAKADIESYKAMGCEIEETVNESKSGRKTTNYKAAHTVDSILKGITENLVEYINKAGEKYTPLLIEQAFVTTTKDHEGNDNPWPLKMRLDLVAAFGDKVVIIDHKYQGQDPDTDEDGDPMPTPAMILQAAAYVSGIESVEAAIEAEKNYKPKITTVLFDAFNKKSGNLTQVRVEVGTRELMAWGRIYRAVQRQLWNAYSELDFDEAFLPNPNAMFNSDGWTEYMKDIDLALDGKEREKITISTKDYEAYEL